MRRDAEAAKGAPGVIPSDDLSLSGLLDRNVTSREALIIHGTVSLDSHVSQDAMGALAALDPSWMDWLEALKLV